jgi:hypothetical protein
MAELAYYGSSSQLMIIERVSTLRLIGAFSGALEFRNETWGQSITTVMILVVDICNIVGSELVAGYLHLACRPDFVSYILRTNSSSDT